MRNSERKSERTSESMSEKKRVRVIYRQSGGYYVLYMYYYIYKGSTGGAGLHASLGIERIMGGPAQSFIACARRVLGVLFCFV